MSRLVSSPKELSGEQVVAVRDLLSSYCGVYLDDSRHETLRVAVQRRAELLGRPLQTYIDDLRRSPTSQEVQLLTELLLNHETVFFRHRPHMAALQTVLLPELHRRLGPGEPIRIWSAGCATGEEAYSIAISVLEALGDPPTRPVQILGSDLSEAALERARAGVYRGRTLGNLSEAQRQRFFSPRSANSLIVSERVRQLVRFEQRNLLDPIPPEIHGMHMIFCQNVTIYFQLETCRDLMGRFYAALGEGGTLFLGFSETLWKIFNRFRWREVSGTYVYYKESQRAALPPTAPLPALPPGPTALQQRARTAPLATPSSEEDLIERGRRLIDAGAIEAALEVLAAAPLSGAKTPQILALAARAHANRGELDLAAAEAHRALALDPLTTDAHLLIGMIYARQGQPAEAISQLERARYLDTSAPLISFHLAECYRQVGRDEAARREYRNTIQKLAGQPPDRLIDGVAVRWLSETCQRYLTTLNSGRA